MSKLNILITGTRKGIGLSLAKHYLSLGHRVHGCSRTMIELEHENYTHYCVDVGDEDAVKQMVRDIKRQSGDLDALINNAGMASMNHSLVTPFETVTNIIKTNFSGTFLLSREVGKGMVRKKWGRIINFSTVAVPLNLEGEAIYSSSKSAIEQFSRVLAKELGSYGITVNTIGPTPIETDLIKAVPQDKIKNIISEQAIKRLGTFDDIINLVDFLLRKESDFITGQTIYLGGISK